MLSQEARKKLEREQSACSLIHEVSTDFKLLFESGRRFHEIAGELAENV